MKVIFIGAGHSTISSVKKIRALYGNDIDITIVSKSEHVGYIKEGLPLSIQKLIPSQRQAFYITKEELEYMKCTVKTNHEAIEVNKNSREITIKNLDNGEVSSLSYDKLVVATGSTILSDNVSVKSSRIMDSFEYEETFKLLQSVNNYTNNNITIIGSGWVGMKLVSSLLEMGKKVNIIETKEMLFPQFDELLLDGLFDSTFDFFNVKQYLSTKVKNLKEEKEKIIVSLDNGEIFETDYVIWASNRHPKLDFIDVKKTLNGELIVDEYSYTSDKNILAIGDNAHNEDLNLINYKSITSAYKTGINAANNIFENNIPMSKFNYALGTKILGYNLYSIGRDVVNENISKTYYEANLLDNFIGTSNIVKIILFTNEIEDIITGVQIICSEDLTHLSYSYSLIISQKIKMEYILNTDFMYSPEHNSLDNIIKKGIIISKNRSKDEY